MRALFTALLMFASASASCCTSCNRQLREAIYDERLLPSMPVMFSSFILLALAVAVLAWITLKKSKPNALPGNTSAYLPLLAAAAILGSGLGGFLDGIVFHQVLQVHGMLSAKIFPSTALAKSVNMFWDGIFHLFTLLVTITGIVLLWHLLRRPNLNTSGYVFSGGLLLGWSGFNLIEGMINHHLLGLHNVNEFSYCPQNWNTGFTIASLLLLVPAWLLVRRGRRIEKNFQPPGPNTTIHG